MQKIFWWWPLLVAAAITWPLNVSWAVMPSLLAWGVKGWTLLAIVEIMASLELTYWWWFFGWLGRSIQKLRPVKDVMDLGKEKIRDFKDDRYIRWRYLDPVKNHFLKQYDWLNDPDNAAMKWLKWGGHGMIFFFGIEPFVPGLRIVGAFFCRLTNQKSGLITLLVGNFLHIVIMVSGWNWIFSLFGR